MLLHILHNVRINNYSNIYLFYTTYQKIIQLGSLNSDVCQKCIDQCQINNYTLKNL